MQHSECELGFDDRRVRKGLIQEMVLVFQLEKLDGISRNRREIMKIEFFRHHILKKDGDTPDMPIGHGFHWN